MIADLSAQILSHAIEAVRASHRESVPFPHAIIPDFFPQKIYDDLLDFLPKDSEYEPFVYNKNRTQDGGSSRLRFRMQNEWLDRLCGTQRTFWYAIRQALGAQSLKQVVYEKLSEGLAYRFEILESKVKDISGYALPELFRELSSYQIKPHPDTRRKVVTMQISLPRDSSQQYLGTEFYKRSFNPLHMTREPRGFKIVKCTPFLPNSAYCFSVLNTVGWKSWHGRSTLPPNCGVRNSILNIWYQNVEDANLDLAGVPESKAA